jgi:glycosyltransferase involved in cell wall biosynthesis
VRTALVINQFALPRSQGGGTRHVDLFSRLDGWDYVILAGDRNYASQQPFTAEPPHFRTVSVPGHSGSSRQRILGWGVFAAKATVAGLRQRQVDAVYASSPQMLAAVAGWVVARARRVPFILEIRDLWPDSIAGAGLVGERSRVFRALRQLERTLYHAADRIVVVTGGWEEHFDALGVSRDKLVVIPNGTDEEAFQVDEDREALRAEFGLTRPTAVYAGAHGPANALHLLVQAAKETPELDLLLVGAGTEKDRLRELAAGTPNIRFLDPMPKAELARLLAACDVGVHCIEDLPILERGMSPNKVFDYLAAGLPVVSNAGAGLAKVMRDDECGATGGTNDLAALLRRTVAGLPENRERWVSRGRGILAAGHSRAAASTALESVLDEGNGGKHERSSTRRRIEVAHLTTAHTPTDNRIFRKEVLALHRAGVDVCLVAPAPEDMADRSTSCALSVPCDRACSTSTTPSSSPSASSASAPSA